MTSTRHLIAIDQGTTSTRSGLFNDKGQPLFTAQTEFTQIFPQDGWVEHNAEEIWQSVLSTCRDVVAESKKQGGSIAGLGITNQRETSLIWNRSSGEVVYNAIVWQDRRTADYCKNLKSQGYESMITNKTGLLLDPYFSNIHENQWDEELLALFNIPASLLPEVHDCASDFGMTDSELFGESINIAGIAGDQHAASIGQACFEPGMIKSTYGTGCFVMVNTGNKAVTSENRLLTTIAYRLNGETTYAIEGSIFNAGTAVQWLRDGLGIIKSASETEALASGQAGNKGVYLVPAFTGMGAPYWECSSYLTR